MEPHPGHAARFVVCVTIRVVADKVDAFVAATRANAEGTRKEPKNLRFDVLRANDDATRFFLYEVYTDEAGFAEHQRTAHYLAWREAVAPWMAEPRVGVKHGVVFPDLFP
ncbi:MAG TPA: antibiotic biosynthesis monooxygenase [Polyangiaceae bacterium]|jgi:autoinducer 2-degrading protein